MVKGKGAIMSKWLTLAFLIVVVDQATKALVLALLQYNEPVSVLPFIDFTLLYNTGAAFSFLANNAYAHYVLTLLAMVVSAGIIFILTRNRPKTDTSCALALILGGALGNLIDRLRFGYVVDYIDIYIRSYHWPAFNIADAAISIGALLLCLASLKSTDRAAS